MKWLYRWINKHGKEDGVKIKRLTAKLNASQATCKTLIREKQIAESDARYYKAKLIEVREELRKLSK